MAYRSQHTMFTKKEKKRENERKAGRNAHMHTWRIIFTTHMSNKGLTTTIYKEVLGINKKGTQFSGKALTWHT